MYRFIASTPFSHWGPLIYLPNKTSHLPPLLFFPFSACLAIFALPGIADLMYYLLTGRCKGVCVCVGGGSKQKLDSDFINNIEGLSILEKHSTTAEVEGENDLLSDSKGGTWWLWLFQTFHFKQTTRIHPSPLSHTLPSLSGSPMFKGHSSSFLLQDKYCTW